MQRLLLFAARHPWPVLLFLGLVTLLAALQLPSLRLEITAEGMMVRDDPARQFYLDVLDTFGSENVTVIYLQDPDLFDPAVLESIRSLVEKIEQSPEVLRTDSLFSVRNLRTEEGYTYTDPYFATVPATEAQARALAKLALRNPLVKGSLLADDLGAMAINVYLDSAHYSRGMDERVAAFLGSAIEPLQQRLKRVFFIGDPSVRTGISDRIKEDQRFIIPLALLVLILSLAFILRRWGAALIPLTTALTSVIWTLGLMAWLGIPVNVMTSIVPALLIIIGSTEDIHLLAEYHAARSRGRTPKRAMRLMARHMGLAISLTFLTTWFGFFSIALNSLDLLRQFGLIASTGLFFNFFITVLLVPAFIRLLAGFDSRRTPKQPWPWLPKIALSATNATLKYRTRAFLVLAVLVVVTVSGAPRLQVNNNVMSYFSEGSAVHRAAQVLDERLSGIQAFSVVVTGPPGAFLKIDNLQALRTLQELMEETGRLGTSVSFADLMSVVHGGLDSEVPGVFYLPEDDEALEAYAGFLDRSWLKPFVSPDFGQARIVVRHNISSSRELNVVVDDLLEEWRAWGTPGLEVQVTGESYLNNRAVDYMARGQALSLLLMLLVILLVISLLFMRLRAGLIAMSVNLFPIMMLFGVMGWLNMPLDVGTAMVGAIALGIAVDNTMHLMVRYQRLMHRQFSGIKALRRAVEAEASPIISTAIALALGFSVLMVSDFPPVVRFGALSALVIILAGVGTFVLLPLLLHGTRLVGVWDLLSLKLRREVIEECPLFSGLHPWQVRRILAGGRMKRIAQDQVISREGKPANRMGVLLEGKAEVWRQVANSSSIRTSLLEPGDVFDLSGLLPGRKRSATVIALTPCRVITIGWKDVDGMARYHPRTAFILYKNLSSIVFQLLSRSETEQGLLHDELTGTYSTAYVMGTLKTMMARGHRQGKPLSIVVLHVREKDDKELNWISLNRHMQQIARVAQGHIRQSDVVARNNERHFWLLLPDTDEEHATNLTERLRKAFGQLEFVINGQIEISMKSFHCLPNESYTALINRLRAA